MGFLIQNPLLRLQYSFTTDSVFTVGHFTFIRFMAENIDIMVWFGFFGILVSVLYHIKVITNLSLGKQHVYAWWCEVQYEQIWS